MSLETNEFEQGGPCNGAALQAMGGGSDQWGESDVGSKSIGDVGVQGWGNAVDQTGMLRSDFESLDSLGALSGADALGSLRSTPGG